MNAVARGALASLLPLAGLTAQDDHHRGRPTADTTARWSGGAMAIGVATHAAPAALGRPVTEGYLTQPMLLGSMRLAGGHLQGIATVNLEGITLRRGEINPGVFGEGFVDRRHPHTYLHEAMLGAVARIGVSRLSAFLGKGFVPFGTDDPMVRPFVKYPANHHLAQVMERVQLVAALRIGAAALEVAHFNGDEPEDPADWPNPGRAFDSWAARLSARIPGDIELSGSSAHVNSPEFATGEGLDHRKLSMSARRSRPSGLLRYAMAEWERTNEFDSNGRRAFSYHSLLAEGELSRRDFGLALRVERTERPEEDRLDDPYRSVRPLLDFNVLGRTRWDIVTVGLAAPPLRRGVAAATPFLEAAWLRPRPLARPAAIDPQVFFGARQLWTWSIGVRLHAGVMRRRFGRYGAALLESRSPSSRTSRVPASPAPGNTDISHASS